MGKSKYLKLLSIALIFIFAISIKMSSTSDFDISFIELIFTVLILFLFFSIPLYFFSKYKTFHLHFKTSKYLGNLTTLFLFAYHLIYSCLILSVVFVITVELAGRLDSFRSLSILLLVLIVLLIFSILYSLFFFIMHRLATKSNESNNKKSEDTL
jgi:hypothetical protein